MGYEGTVPGWDKDMRFAVMRRYAEDVDNPRALYALKEGLQ